MDIIKKLKVLELFVMCHVAAGSERDILLEYIKEILSDAEDYARKVAEGDDGQ